MSTSASNANAAAASSDTKPLEEKLSSILSSSTQFSVGGYLNQALEEAASSHDGDELQRRMAELALQLQLQTQSCHDDIGRIGAELQAIMPRCAADVGRIGVGLEGMRIDAASLSASSVNPAANQEVSSSMETLSTLHALQANLKRTKDILAAAASWDSTLSSIAPLLSTQNLTEAVAALQKLESGERALRGMPQGRDEREESIAKIREQVQVMLQPQLRHALQNMNTRLSPLQQCVSLYTSLGKMEKLKQEYVKNRPGAIHKSWFAYTPPSSTTTTTTTSTSSLANYDSKAAEEGLFDGVDTTPPVEEDAITKQQQDPASAFVEWLPSWYDAVLTLLAEERRQSLAVFGPQLAPEIIAKVLGECFRPLLSSFQKRLETIYSPGSKNMTTSSSLSSSGSLESICAIYEATLQFLSLAYECVAGCWFDMSESFNSLNAKEVSKVALDLYSDVSAVFLQVASPFCIYQERFAELERMHSGVATKLVSKDIQQAVSSVSSHSDSLMNLQDATERLKGLSPFIFPLAEGGLVRFELLNAGYHAQDAISSIDKLLANHSNELAMAIVTLSASMTTDQMKLADNFDEQHVHCALEVLNVAGIFRRGLRTFDFKTKERLGVLCERMAAFAVREKEIQQASSDLSSSGGTSFLLPDSLSVVEIDSMLTKAVCGNVDDDDEINEEEANPSYEILQRLSNTDTSSANLFPDAEDATSRLASSCHSFVFDVCSAVPNRHLGGMSEMSSWKETSGAGAFDSYGTLPQQYITQVGEHMLSLVQALEPFASDADALALANEIMNDVKDVALQPWREFAAAAGSDDANDDNVIRSLMDGKALTDNFIIARHFVDEEDEEELLDDQEQQDENEKASAAFCDAWIDVVGLAVTGRLLERIMRIPHLTPKGCEHLAADLNYVINVFSALGVPGHPHPLLNHFVELAMMDGEELRAKILSRDKSIEVVAAVRAAEVRIANMRMIAVS